LTGKINDRGNIEYVMKLCSVLNTILDSSKLRAKIEKMSGALEEEEEEEEEEVVDEEGGDVEEETVLDFTSPTVLTSILYDEIESERERVIYDYGEIVKKEKASLRIRNALSAMSLIGRFMKKFKYGFLGEHVGEQYANRFLKVKFETEIKSFLTQLNSPTKYVL